MCGRYVMSKARGDLLAYYDAQESDGPGNAAVVERRSNSGCPDRD